MERISHREVTPKLQTVWSMPESAVWDHSFQGMTKMGPESTTHQFEYQGDREAKWEHTF